MAGAGRPKTETGPPHPENRMTFRPVDTGWASELVDGLREDARELRIVCPFIRARALAPLLALQPELIRVITRFKLADFADGVSDLTALRNLIGAGASVRGIRNLHAKLYLLGANRAIVTSANLTEAGLWRNHEFGMFTDDHAAVGACHAYFDDLWGRAGDDLGLDQLEKWTATVTQHLASGARPGRSVRLEDFGADADIDDPPRLETPQLFADPPQAFVKFLGDSTNRAPACFLTLDEIDRAGCHWALSYPLNKRPRRVEDGAVMFIARLTDEPDIRVFGRAIGMKHQEGRDDATPADIERRPGIERWPHYIRVHHAEFVAGTMVNGVSLNELWTPSTPIPSRLHRRTRQRARATAILAVHTCANPTSSSRRTDSSGSAIDCRQRSRRTARFLTAPSPHCIGPTPTSWTRPRNSHASSSRRNSPLCSTKPAPPDATPAASSPAISIEGWSAPARPTACAWRAARCGRYGKIRAAARRT